MTNEKPKIKTVYPDQKLSLNSWGKYIKDELSKMMLGNYQKKRA